MKVLITGGNRGLGFYVVDFLQQPHIFSFQ
ncbi:hypothetical protein DJ93_212 [Bacillus clarus]|uniref:Uncharacterized protein n=1 Tax=Bacillus clarus TaxID=2338372 RepID=A0A090Z205_9BACI|nr:hypothetical protein DJ93_212 [Bacillus clarus]